MSPLRRAVPWIIFGPFLVMAISFVFFASGAEDRSLGWILLLSFLTVVLSLHIVIGLARLELSPEGILLKQIGMRMHAPWTQIAGISLEKGREGFIASTSLEGGGAARLAAVRGFGLYGSPLYDETQRAAMAERRWIPIEAFAWHLKRGTLATEIERFAPGLLSRPETVASARPAPPLPAGRRWLIGGIIGLALGTGIALALAPPIWEEHFFVIASAVVAPLLALRAAWSANNAFRAPSRLLGFLFSLLALVFAFWWLGAWIDLAALF